MIVLGIDPGYDRVGWAVLETATPSSPSVLDLGCIQTNKTDNLYARYSQIALELQAICHRLKPQEVALEKIFFSKNQKTAMHVSESRGVIIATLIPFSLQLGEYTPNQIKLAVTGHGSADKTAVEKMIRMQLLLPKQKIIDDTIDAVAIAFTHILLRKQNI